MSITMFDTLKFARKLKESGMSEAQATSQAEAIQGAFAEAINTRLATKDNIHEVKDEIHELRGDIQQIVAKTTLLQWMVGLIILVEVIPLLKTWL